jgi:CDP-glycerol glycerophosphotransferase
MKYLFFLLLYLLSFIFRPFFKVNKELLIFSARGGVGFEDNPKYLFLYTLKNTNYRCIWITKDKKILSEMKQNGYEVYYYLSKDALFLTLQANSIFISHSITDVMPISFNKKSKIINLWHGIPIKKIALLDKNQTLKSKILYKLNKRIITYFISNHKTFNTIYQKAFALDFEQIIALGLPRIEYLKNPNKFVDNLKNKLNDNFINYLYAPTFRDYDFNNPLLEPNTLVKLDKFFEDKKIKLYIKLHPQENSLTLNDYKNIYFIKDDIYEILPFFKNFISDYSSLIYDFTSAFPNGNLVLYTPDFEKYEKERGFFIDFKEVFKDCFFKDYKEIFEINNQQYKVIEINYDNSCINILELV